MRKPPANNKKKKSTFKGPYHSNPDLAIHNVKKSMRPQLDGPTVDNFSTIDSTNSTKQLDSSELKPKSQRVKRPTTEKPKRFNVSIDAILGIAFAIGSAIVGIVIYNHSNRFVSIEKDIDYIKENAKDTKSRIEKVVDQTTSIDRKIDLLKQKSELEQKKK
jgi:hypothetical protein